MLPAAASKSFADYFGLNSGQLTLTNTFVETSISGFFEPKERFNILNRKFFPFIPIKICLTSQLTEEQFNKLIKEYPLKVDEKSTYQEFTRLQNNFFRNRGAMYGCVLSRNLFASSAIFYSKPIAIKYVENNGHKIEQETGIPIPVQAEIFSNVLRLTCAFLTTAPERIHTELASGDKTAREVLRSIDLKTLKRGGIARTIFVALTAKTISDGLELAEDLKEFSDNDPLVTWVCARVTKYMESHRNMKTGGIKLQNTNDSKPDKTKTDQVDKTLEKIDEKFLKKTEDKSGSGVSLSQDQKIASSEPSTTTPPSATPPSTIPSPEDKSGSRVSLLQDQKIASSEPPPSTIPSPTAKLRVVTEEKTNSNPSR